MRDVELIIESIRRLCLEVTVTQLQVLHPGADDDGIWFFNGPVSPFEVQIESTHGICPFLIETDESNDRYMAKSVEEVVRILSVLLRLGGSL
jgi:hypothetical protein